MSEMVIRAGSTVPVAHPLFFNSGSDIEALREHLDRDADAATRRG
jgi:hypothetical protein